MLCNFLGSVVANFFISLIFPLGSYTGLVFSLSMVRPEPTQRSYQSTGQDASRHPGRRSSLRDLNLLNDFWQKIIVVNVQF